MAPLDMTEMLGSSASFLMPFVLGVGFGAVLEMSGFGDSRKLAGQFYLKDLTVLKVMFSAIVVAAVLLGASASFGLLDMERVWVNPTFLLPGVLGGFIMGIGFIVGGFCPGTSLVASATLKLDGIVFALGVMLGVFVFGETVGSFDGFWHSTSYGRLTLPEVFGVPDGVVIVAVVLMALFMFRLAELAEAWFGRGERGPALRFLPRRRAAWAWGGGLALLAALTMFHGRVDVETRWARVAQEKGALLADRAVFAHPMEVAELTQDTAVYVRVLDVRSEAHYNLFHLKKAELVSLEQLTDPAFVASLKAAPANTAFFTVSNDEARAVEAWRLLAAQGVPNLYIVEGGVNRWLELYPPPSCLAVKRAGAHAPDTLAFDFFRAAGDCCNSAYPKLAFKEVPRDCYLAAHANLLEAHSKAGHKKPGAPRVPFERKVKLQKKAAVKGGCG